MQPLAAVRKTALRSQSAVSRQSPHLRDEVIPAPAFEAATRSQLLAAVREGIADELTTPSR